VWYQWSKQFTTLFDSLESDFKNGLVDKSTARNQLKMLAGSVREFNDGRLIIESWKELVEVTM